MRTKRARAAIAVLSGVALAGSVAGCATGTASMSAHALKELAAAQALSSATPTARSTVKPNGTPTAMSTVHPTATATPEPGSLPSTAHHTTTPAAPQAAPKPIATPSPTPTFTAVYNDGSYNATGNYQSPGGAEKIRVTLTLSNDIIESVAVTPVHVDSTAAGYEADFASGVGAVVNGKDIDSINVGAVSGSSLTAVGFNQAIAKIKASAKI